MEFLDMNLEVIGEKALTEAKFDNRTTLNIFIIKTG
jgi:hypothetical protein